MGKLRLGKADSICTKVTQVLVVRGGVGWGFLSGLSSRSPLLPISSYPSGLHVLNPQIQPGFKLFPTGLPGYRQIWEHAWAFVPKYFVCVSKAHRQIMVVAYLTTQYTPESQLQTSPNSLSHANTDLPPGFFHNPSPYHLTPPKVSSPYQ